METYHNGKKKVTLFFFLRRNNLSYVNYSRFPYLSNLTIHDTKLFDPKHSLKRKGIKIQIMVPNRVLGDLFP